MQPTFSSWTDQEIVQNLAQDNQEVYEYIFRLYYTPLCRFALKFVREKEITEEIVQEVFIYIWEKRLTIRITQSLKAYLYTAVRNRSINYIKAQMHTMEVDNLADDQVPFYVESERDLDYQELKQSLAQAMDKLPRKCRMIFDLSRNEGLTYKEIAEALDISKKTVEAQMSIALKKLRESLSKSWDRIALILLFWLWN